jgi:hypothetical protein
MLNFGIPALRRLRHPALSLTQALTQSAPSEALQKAL